MKYVLLLLLVSLSLCQPLQAQVSGSADTAIHLTDLNEVIIKNTPAQQLSRRIRSQPVSILLPATVPDGFYHKADSVYYMTELLQPENAPVKLHSVELYLQTFDTSLFDIKLMIFQVSGNDTLQQILPVPAERIDKNKRLRLDAWAAGITLQPGIFFMGYGFHPKSIPAPYRYRLYATNQGNGALLTQKSGHTDLISNPHLPYVFSFKMWYRKQ